MSSFVVYSKISADEIRKEGADAKEQIKAWFESNPKRKVCLTKVWYGK